MKATCQEPVRLSLHAMATRFELVLYGEDPVRLRAAGEEALAEVERLDKQLSRYRPDSDLSRVNARAAAEEVRVDARLFRLLQRCRQLHEQTSGAFDVTVAPLIRAWGFDNGSGRPAEDEELREARAVIGMKHVRFDERRFTMGFDHRGVELDLGAIGKGYAVEQAVAVLHDNGIGTALLHGGTSSVHGIGAPPGLDSWRVAVHHPVREEESVVTLDLRDTSLAVSAVHGKAYVANGRQLGHIIDPRSGHPVEGPLVAAVTGPSATDCDALSTALLVLGKPGLDVLRERFPEYRAYVLSG